MRVVQAINQFFLAEEEEEIHWSDYIWFYGSYVLILGILVFTFFI
jgi:hypothetical protein